jgi:hypothetical protein
LEAALNGGIVKPKPVNGGKKTRSKGGGRIAREVVAIK